MVAVADVQAQGLHLCTGQAGGLVPGGARAHDICGRIAHQYTSLSSPARLGSRKKGAMALGTHGVAFNGVLPHTPHWAHLPARA